MSRAFGGGGGNKPAAYDPLRIVTHTVPQRVQEHAPFALATVVALKADESEVGRTVLEKTGFELSTISAGIATAAAFAPVPLPRWARNLALDLVLGIAMAKGIRQVL